MSGIDTRISRQSQENPSLESSELFFGTAEKTAHCFIDPFILDIVLPRKSFRRFCRFPTFRSLLTLAANF